MTTTRDDTIHLPDAPGVPGLRFRRFRGPDDYAAMTVVGNASRLADGAEWVVTADDVARIYAHLVNTDPATDMIVAEIDGEMAGFTRGEWELEDETLHLYKFGLTLAPQWRGHGLRRAMLHWIESRLRQMAAGHPADAPKLLATSTWDKACLLYTSDAADERSSVDLGGRRIIKKKNTRRYRSTLQSATQRTTSKSVWPTTYTMT